MKYNFIYEDFNLNFDRDRNPILDTEEAKKDYQILRDIFFNPYIMSTSSAFCGNIPSSDKEFHILIYNLLLRDSTDNNIKKIYNKKNELIGIAGCVPSKQQNNMYEVAVFLHEEFHNKFYGYCIFADSLAKLPSDSICIASTFNAKAQKVLNKFNFKLHDQYTKAYCDNYICVDLFILNKTFNDTKWYVSYKDYITANQEISYITANQEISYIMTTRETNYKEY